MPETILSIDGVSELIGAIYDCAIAPEQWPSALERLRSAVGLGTAVLGLNALPSGETTLLATAGIAPEWLARMPGYGEDILSLWGGPERVARYPLEEPIVQSQASDPVQWETNRWAVEWGRPQGLRDAIGFVFTRDATMVANLTCGVRELVSERHQPLLGVLRFLAPHVRRAVAISRLLDLKTIEAATFASALESLAAGVVLVDAQLGIVHMNAAAALMLAAADPIRSHRGHLVLTSAPADAALGAAVAAAARNEREIGRRGMGIPLHRRDGTPCVAHVLPLCAGERRPGLGLNAAAAVFVASAAGPRIPADALAFLYDLTPAESRVFELIVEGRTQPEIAAALGIAPSTVKTHLLRVFDKTGCRRQAGLVKLAASVSLPF